MTIANTRTMSTTRGYTAALAAAGCAIPMAIHCLIGTTTGIHTSIGSTRRK